MVAMQACLEQYLNSDWRVDLPAEWQGIFADCKALAINAPGLVGIDLPEGTPIFPQRRGQGLDSAPQGSHLCRAFDGIAPANVRVVVLGQDPYPDVARATGRAFEDGAWDGNNPATAADSLRRLLQSAAACARPNLGISEETDDWTRIWDAVHRGGLAPPIMPRYFDDLAAQGVLCVNAAWTFTGRARTHLDVHLKVWKPVVKHLILGMITREGGGPVFLQLGGKARNLFRGATWRHLRANPEINVRTVYCAHPTAWTGQTYFNYENPLTRVNQALAELDAGEVRWWPELPQVEA
ncbi:hypothetical protein [Sedimentitalea arenosa]|uniref:Uracil-DNA glycosylase n=1 Tax=Sedimentitalea arenosa TaxID=2798803 RepID=A0A8J7LTX1_9RHOB|nr:hypothetical protein [Arenibacterium arenosum]MBJ6373659.1 hypothetical protein [Arenibacterium arenosum]